MSRGCNPCTEQHCPSAHAVLFRNCNYYVVVPNLGSLTTGRFFSPWRFPAVGYSVPLLNSHGLLFQAIDYHALHDVSMHMHL